MTTTASTRATLILNELTTARFWTAASIAVRTGLDRNVVSDILEEFAADGLVKSRPHDCTRMTYKLAA